MYNISNITSQIAKLSRQLTQARHDGDVDEIEYLEDELAELEDQLADASDDANDHSTSWH